MIDRENIKPRVRKSAIVRKVFMTMIALLVCFVQTTAGQEVRETDNKGKQQRKKIALVLSGGGAKGTAHVGVLKVLERVGMPIDIITGTSMGSIVGGIYACGHRAHELDSVFKMQNWSFVLSDREDLSHQSLSEREKQNTYIISKSLNFGKASPTPGGGFIMGKNIITMFDALTMPYHDSIDFNTLPIPFACVATDVVDNSEQVFHSGILSRAMRASVAIPGVFAPVRIGDKVLVDGGLRNNYPADVARAMGADYIIGVDVSSELKAAPELNSTSSILLQIVDHNCKDKFQENQAITDIMIRVNTKGYSSASFTTAAIDTLIRRGEEAAMEHWDELVALCKEIGNPLPPVSNQGRATPPPVTSRYKIGELRFRGMSKSDETYIRTKFRLHVGDSIDMNRADIIATAIRQDLYYKTATFRIINNTDHTAATVIFIAGQQKGNQINIGGRFDSEEMVAIEVNAELPIRSKIPMDVDLTLRLGKRLMARADWSLHPISFFRPTISYAFRINDIDLFDYGDKAYSITYNQHTAKLTLFNFNARNLNFSIGANWEYFDYHSLLFDHRSEHIADALLKDTGYVSYEAKAWYNSENDWYFPTSGARLHARFAYYTDNFALLDGKVGIRDYSMIGRMNIPIGSKLSLQPMLYGRALYCDDVPFVLSNVIGGEWYGHYFDEQMPFAGVGNVELAWDKMVAAQMQAQYRLTKNNILLLRFAAGQDGQTFHELLHHRTMLGGSLCYYYNSIFGPLGGSLGYNNLTKRLSYYINLGFVF